MGRSQDERLRQDGTKKADLKEVREVKTNSTNGRSRFRIDIIDTQSGRHCNSFDVTERIKVSVTRYVLKELGQNSELYT